MRAVISKSDRKDKKYKIVVYGANDKKLKTLHIGAKGMEDYTQHKDEERKERYIQRHQKREVWTKDGLLTNGFFSRWLTWNLPTLQESAHDIERRFNIKVVLQN